MIFCYNTKNWIYKGIDDLGINKDNSDVLKTI